MVRADEERERGGALDAAAVNFFGGRACPVMARDLPRVQTPSVRHRRLLWRWVQMHLVDVVLFLHISAALLAFGTAGALHAVEWLSRGATSVEELRTSGRASRLGRLFPFAILLLLVLGAWLLHLSEGSFSFSDGWVWTAVVALVILGATGGLIMDKHAKVFRDLLATTPDGPVPDAVREVAFDARAWTVGHFDTALALAVVFNMTTKPDTLGSIVVLVVGGAIGGVVGLAGARGGLQARVA